MNEVSVTEEVRILDKVFVPLISATDIRTRIGELGQRINADHAGKSPLLIAVLNGSFIFAADLFRTLQLNADITFVKLSSYAGTASTGQVVTSLPLIEPIEGRDVIIVEDIVDTGKTLASFLPSIVHQRPASLRIAAFLSKPTALQHDVRVDYTAFEIADRFVVGYGLDYNGYGRNLPGLYVLKGE